MLDADNGPNQTWRRVAGQLTSALPAIPLPTGPTPSGVIIPEDASIGNPRIGIWIMPDNSTDGELENFVADMIPNDDPVWPLSQQYIDSIPPQHRKFAPGKCLRAQIHAWLAVREDPRQMGLAIRTRSPSTTPSPKPSSVGSPASPPNQPPPRPQPRPGPAALP